MDDPHAAGAIAVVAGGGDVDPPIAAAGGAGAEAVVVAAAANAEANGGPPDDAGAAPPGPEGQDGEGGGAEGLRDEDFRGVVGLRNFFEDTRSMEELFLENDDPDNVALFPRFVTELGRLREGGRIVRKIYFRVNWSRLPSGDVERLFRDVLPYHPTLVNIELEISRLPVRVLRLLTAAPPNDNGDSWLPGLDIRGVFNQEKFQTIVDMLNSNVALSDLHLDMTLGANECTRICQALPRNTKLQYLNLYVEEVVAGALDGVAASSLQSLTARGSFSDDALPSLARELRDNETLQYLYLHNRNNGPDDAPALLELVGTYNFTLRDIHGPWGSVLDSEPVRAELEGCMSRNARIREALLQLQQSGQALHPVLWPSVLGLVSGHPTAMFRVLHTNAWITFNNTLLELAARRRQLAHEDQERRVRPRM